MFEGKMPKRLPKGLEQAIRDAQRIDGGQITNMTFYRFFRGAQWHVTIADSIGIRAIDCHLYIDANKKIVEVVCQCAREWSLVKRTIMDASPEWGWRIARGMLEKFEKRIETRVKRLLIKEGMGTKTEQSVEGTAKKLMEEINAEIHTKTWEEFYKTGHLRRAIFMKAQEEYIRECERKQNK
jgi:hypothetical protein